MQRIRADRKGVSGGRAWLRQLGRLAWIAVGALIVVSAAGGAEERKPVDSGAAAPGNSFSSSNIELQKQIVDALAAGRDAKALLQRARAATPPAKGVSLPRNDEAAQIERRLNELEKALRSTPKGVKADSYASLISQYEALRAAHLLFEDRFATVGEQISGEKLSNEIESRRKSALADYRKTMASLTEALDPTLGALLASDTRAKLLGDAAFATRLTESLAKAREILAAHASRVAAPILRASTLPFRQAKLAQRAPKLTPTIQPSYLNPLDSGSVAAPADTAPTDDAALNQEILAKAKSLDYDYIRIYEFVRNEIRTEWYAGGMKGAVGTLRQKSGNDVDQASLLIALFRASGLASRYVHGVVELSVDDIAGSLALTDSTQVTNALTRAGVAYTPVIRGGRVAAVNIEHTWVTAQVPYTNYRGAVVDASGKTWVPLAPAVKQFTVAASKRAFAGAGLTASQSVGDYLSQLQAQDPLSIIRKKITDGLQGDPPPTYAQLLGSASVTPKQIGLLPNTMPVKAVAVTEESATLSDAHRQRVRLVVRQGTRDTDPIVVDTTSTLAKLASERLTLSYIPATVEDQRTVDLFGGVDNVPAYLVKLRAQIKLNGRALAVATDSVATGSLNRLEIRLLSPAGEERIDQTITAGGYEVIALHAQNVARNVIENDPADTEFLAARLLDTVAATYADQWNQSEAELGGLLDVAAVHPWPSVTVVGSAFKVDTVLGRAMQLDWQGVTIDAALHVSEPIARDGTAATAKQWMQLSALQGSVLEHTVFQDQFLVDSISADKGLALAAVANVPLVQVTAANSATVLPTLNHPPEVKTDIDNWARLGFTITVPRDQTTYADWLGSVWKVEDSTGAAGYFISGGLAGGGTAVAPPGWLLQWLRYAFERANTPQANPDPLAGDSITLLTEVDQQEGEVGTPLPKRLAVLVRDSKGKPVIGAAVTFRVAEGGGSVGGGEAPELTVQTNGAGIAEMDATLGKKTDAFPLFTLLHPGDQYATRIGLNQYDAEVLTYRGVLRVSQPFTAVGMPGAPTHLQRTNPGNAEASINAWSDSIIASAFDQYDNPVSNVDVTFQMLPFTSNCDPPATNARNGVVFPGINGIDNAQPNNCPAMPILGECGSPSITKKTNFQGVWGGFIAGSAAGATYRVLVNSASGSFTVSYPSGSCQTTPHLSYSTIGIINEKGNNVQAAKAGETAKVPARIALYYEFPGITSTPKTVCDGNGNCSIVCDTKVLPDITLRRTTGNVAFSVSNGGRASAARSEGQGVYATDVTTGTSPNINAVTFSATNISRTAMTASPPACVPQETPVGNGDGALNGSAFNVYGVLPQITGVVSTGADPTRIYLNENGQAAITADLQYVVPPSSYTSDMTTVEFFENGTAWDYIVGSTRSGPGIGHIPRGATFDIAKNYEAQVVLNVGSDNEVRSDKFRLAMNQKMFKDVTRDLDIQQDVDVLNQRTCTLADSFRFTMTQPGSVTLTFTDIKNPNSKRELFSDRHFDAGEQVVPVMPSDLPAGAYTFELKGVSDRDSHEETEVGVATSQYSIQDSLAVGHVIVKGVDLKDGHMVLGSEDLKIPGRGSGLEFRRSYASNAPYKPGPLGVRWFHNYQSKINVTPCGEAIISGGEGSGMRFVEDGNGGLKPLKGYHGTLIANQADHTFDFYSKDGIRYHYRLMGTRADWDLDFIEDTNHNVTKLTYDEASPKIAKLLLVEDSSKRQLKFTYENHPFALRAEATPVIRQIDGPGGLQVLFDYDDNGNLITVTRGERVEKYEYTPVTALMVTSSVLNAYVNPNGARTTYQYNSASQSLSAQGIPTFTVPNSYVTAVTDGTNGTTHFQLDTATWLSATVTDPNGHAVSYTLNAYGSPLTISDAAGTTTMTWSTSDVNMLTKRDGRGTVTSYAYDTDGNVTSETVDGKSTSYTYQSFTFPPIKNRVKTRTDRNGNVTTFTYDGVGNLVTQKDAEGGTTSHGYAGNGDRISTQDPRGNTTRIEYDQYGNIFSTTDPAGGVTRTVWDVRSNPVQVTDPLSRLTTLGYDGLDRLILKTDALGGTHAYTYDPVGNKLSETDEENHTTRWSYDGENRPKTNTNAASVTRTIDYDDAGNKVAETDWNGNSISYGYDAANRVTRRTEPLGRVTTFAYDAVGNVTSETDALSHSISYEYDALSRRTKRTDARSGVTTYTYDGLGNKLSEKDALGRETTFTYDKLNRLTQTTEPLGRITKTTYDGNGNKTQETDPNGGVRKFAYDALNRLTKRTSARGVDTNISYDAVGNVTTQVNGRLAATKYTYDKLNRLESITDPSSAVTSHTYDGVGNRLTDKLPNGNTVTNTYDALNRLVSTVDTLGPVNTYEYDSNGNRTHETDANSNETVRTYDALNRLTQATLSEGRVLKYGYDTVGNKISETDARNHVTQFHYDELNRLDLSTDPLSHTVAYTYDAVGNRKTQTDKRGKLTTFDYDDLNRVTKVTDALSRTVVYTYDNVGNRKTETDKRGTLTQYTYDAENQLLTVVKGGLTLQTLQYDEVGNKKFVQDAVGNITTYIYDLRNLVLTESRPLAAITTYKYDSVGSRTEMRDPENRTSKFTYDLRGRLLTETNAANETTTYTYDGNGNRLSLAKPKSNTSAYVYDGANRLTTVTEPLSGVTRYTYDKNNNRLTQEDANHHTTTNEYDELNRVSAVVYPDSARSEFRYDENGNRIGLTDARGQVFSYTFDDLNRETSSTYPAPTPSTGDDVQSIATQYDENNNVTRVTENYSGATGVRITTKGYDVFDRLIEVVDAFGRRVGYQYDANGNRTALVDPDSKVTRYTFDALNRVSTVTNAAGVTTYEYDRSSLQTKTTYPNGTSSVTAYDAATRVATVSNKQGASVVSSYQYTYDHNGNRLTQTEANGGVAELTTYTYDNDDRLLSVAYPDKTTTYTYDAAYNRLTERTVVNATSSVTTDRAYTYNARNQLTTITDGVSAANSVAYDYDANGNQTIKTKNGVTTTFVYDVRDQLIAVRENLTTLGLFRYDYAGLRISKDMGGQVVRYTYDDDSVLTESDNAGATVAKFDYGSTRLLSMSHITEGRQFYLFDALGSVSNLMNAAGTIQARYQYDAFGNSRAQAGSSFNRFGFTGHERDNETGLYYMKARFYDPDTGRFLSEDPYAADTEAPPSLHRYLYAYANPTVYTDPTGYYSWNEFKRDASDLAEGTLNTAKRIAGATTGAALGVAATAYALGEVVVDLQAAQYGNYEAMQRNVERAKALGQAIAHPIDTAHRVGAAISAEFEGANREDAEGNVFTAAVVRGKIIMEIGLAVDGGVGLARGGVALTGKAVTLVRGARVAEEAAAGGRAAAESSQPKIIGEGSRGPAAETPAVESGAQRSSSRVAEPESTPADMQAAPGEARGMRSPEASPASSAARGMRGPSVRSEPVESSPAPRDAPAEAAPPAGEGTNPPPPGRPSTPDLVQQIANRAEAWGVREGHGPSGSGSVQGTVKHTYAKKLLERYQRWEEYKTGGYKRGLEAEESWLGHAPADYGTKGSVRLDVYDPSTGNVYDYKFVKVPGKGLKPAQINKIRKQGPRVINNIQEINPQAVAPKGTAPP